MVTVINLEEEMKEIISMEVEIKVEMTVIVLLGGVF